VEGSSEVVGIDGFAVASREHQICFHPFGAGDQLFACLRCTV
jgi:hypothetical protein